MQNNLENKAFNPQEFPTPIQYWLENLKRLKIHVLDLCYENFFEHDTQHFSDPSTLQQWEILKGQLTPENPITIQKYQQGFILGYVLNQEIPFVVVGLYVAPPINDITLETIRTSFGWLFHQQQSKQLQKAWQAGQLLEILAHTNSQSQFRIAAQEWVNQTATYLRKNFKNYKDIQLSYLEVINNEKVKWIVSSDIAWTEKGAPDMQKLNELALQALFIRQEYQDHQWWAYPVLRQGQFCAVLIAKDKAFEHPEFSHHDLILYLKNNVDLIQPLLGYWHQSEYGLFQHSIKSSKNLMSKFTSQGNYAWKILGTLIILFLLCITLIPVDKLVTANLNVEGKTRWVIAAPAQGFIHHVMVRPGDKVVKNTLLMQLDDTDLKIQIAEQQSLLDQAQHQFRIAMAEQNLTESGVASNQIQQQQTKIQTLQRKLQQTQIKSPLTGTIVDGDWIQQIGTPIENGQELFQIASQDAYKVILHVADKDIHQVQVNQSGILRLTSLPDQTFTFKITRVTPVASVQENINGFKVEGTWIDSPPALHPGMQGVGKIIVGKTNLLLRWSKDFINWAKLKIWSAW